MVVLRVDNRLVHGQIIEAWLPYTGAEHVFVAQDALAQDPLQQQIMSLAMPQRVQLHFTRVDAVLPLIRAYTNAFVLFENIEDIQKALRHGTEGVDIAYINIGNVHRKQSVSNISDVPDGFVAPIIKHIAPHIYVSSAELKILEQLHENYALDFRSIPSEKKRDFYELHF